MSDEESPGKEQSHDNTIITRSGTKRVFRCPKGCVSMPRENVLLGNGAACYRTIAKEKDPVLPEDDMYLWVVDFTAPVGLKKCYLTLEEYLYNTKKFTNGQKAFKEGDTVSIVRSAVYENYLETHTDDVCCAPPMPPTNEQLMGSYPYPCPFPMTPFPQQMLFSPHIDQFAGFPAQQAPSTEKVMKMEMDVDTLRMAQPPEEEGGGENGMGLYNVKEDEGGWWEEERPKETKTKKRESREYKDKSNVWVIVEGKGGKRRLWQRNVELIGWILKGGTERLMAAKVVGVGYSFMKPRVASAPGGPRCKCYQVSIAPGTTLWVDEELFVGKDGTRDSSHLEEEEEDVGGYDYSWTSYDAYSDFSQSLPPQPPPLHLSKQGTVIPLPLSSPSFNPPTHQQQSQQKAPPVMDGHGKTKMIGRNMLSTTREESDDENEYDNGEYEEGNEEGEEDKDEDEDYCGGNGFNYEWSL